MFTINNTTANAIGPYNSQMVAANSSLTANGMPIAWISDSTLLQDVLSGVATITFAGIESDGAMAAQILLQLGQIVNTDTDGATYSRTKVVPTGMTFCLLAFDFTTATASSLTNNDSTNTPCSDVTMSFYDSSNNPLTSDLSTCVKTVIDFEPVYNYYIIGGMLRLQAAASDDIRAHVIAVPDVPAVAGGSKIMLQNLNVRYISPTDKIELDGRAGKPLSYSATYHTNKIRFIFYHPAAYAQSFMIAMELFR